MLRLHAAAGCRLGSTQGAGVAAEWAPQAVGVCGVEEAMRAQGHGGTA